MPEKPEEKAGQERYCCVRERLFVLGIVVYVSVTYRSKSAKFVTGIGWHGWVKQVGGAIVVA